MAQSAFHFMAQHTGELILIQARDDSCAPQSLWRRTAQGHLLEWLAKGGFHAEAEEQQLQGINENSGTMAAVSQSHPGTQCEELKFTRVRIVDAVE